MLCKCMCVSVFVFCAVSILLLETLLLRPNFHAPLIFTNKFHRHSFCEPIKTCHIHTQTHCRTATHQAHIPIMFPFRLCEPFDISTKLHARKLYQAINWKLDHSIRGCALCSVCHTDTLHCTALHCTAQKRNRTIIVVVVVNLTK